MSSEPPPASPPSSHDDHEKLPTKLPPPSSDLTADIFLWRRRRLNIAILSAATAVWVVMEIFQYNFVPLFSYTAMALLLLLFFWGTTNRLMQKETPDMFGREVSEEAAVETADLFRRRVEEGVRMLFHVSVEREWFVFAGVVAVLYLLSLVGRYLDLLTLSYLGLLVGATVPMVYMKNEQRIREYGEKGRIRSKRLCDMTMEKVMKMKNMIMSGRKKEVKVKKTE